MLALEVIQPLPTALFWRGSAMLEVGTRDGRPLTKAEPGGRGCGRVGLNCRVGPLQEWTALEKTVSFPNGLILTASNAGRFGGATQEYQYESTPEYFGR